MNDQMIADGLATLREPAPAGLLEGVLGRLGLGDAYVQVEGPIGPLFVAFGRDGISLVERARDAGAFEETFRAMFRRPLRRVQEAPELIARIIDARVWGRGKAGKTPVDIHELPDFE